MANTNVVTYAKAACKYCSDEISINAMARHEAICQHSTPEKREERKRQRVERYEAFTKQKEGKAWRKPNGGTQRKVECKFCHDQIGAGSIDKHESKCEHQTPEQRQYSKSQRLYQNTHYNRQKKSEDNRARYATSMRVPSKLDEPVVPDGRTYGVRGANGQPLAKPMSISMLVDEDALALALGRVVIQKLPELLPQLIPGLSIEAFATKSHRAGKV